jgi:hypothetical protein
VLNKTRVVCVCVCVGGGGSMLAQMHVSLHTQFGHSCQIFKTLKVR